MAARLLVAASKPDFGRLPGIIAELRPKVSSGLELVSSVSLPWDRIVHAEGSFDGSCRWAARSFDAIAVVETADGALGAGTYKLAVEFRNLHKSVYVYRSGRLLPVKDVRESGVDDWKQNFGMVLT